MVKTCCIHACHSESYGGCNISFHRFPKNKEMYDKWLKITEVKRVTESSVICSRHFEKSSFYYKNSRNYLKVDAIPSIFPEPKNERIILEIMKHQQSVSSQMKILHPAASLETHGIANPNSSNINEEPLWKLVSLNVKEVGVQTKINESANPVVIELRRKIKVLSLKLSRRNIRLKNLKSQLLLYKKKCEKI